MTVNPTDAAAAEELLPLVYDELRALARSYLNGQSAPVTLQPTALVHEAYLRMAGAEGRRYASRAHFMAVAAKAMRQVLVDHARRRAARKRGGEMTRIALADGVAHAGGSELDVLELDRVLTALGALDERKARVVELRFFGGLTGEQVAEALGIARSTVAEEWRLARAWVVAHLTRRARR